MHIVSDSESQCHEFKSCQPGGRTPGIAAPRVILSASLFLPVYMRRFIVIFLLLLLPVQVLAQSLEDLRTPHHHVSLADADAVSTSAAADVKHSRSSQIGRESCRERVSQYG